MRARAFFICVVVAIPPLAGCGTPLSSPTPVTGVVSAGDGRTLLGEDSRRRLKLYTEQVEHGNLRLSFEGAPAYLQSLEMAPKAREAALDRGEWLVVAVAVWSIPDGQSIFSAVDAVEKQQRGIRLGIRLIDDYDEIKAWHPDFDRLPYTPLWLRYSAGKVVRKEAGILSEKQIAALINLR